MNNSKQIQDSLKIEKNIKATQIIKQEYFNNQNKTQVHKYFENDKITENILKPPSACARTPWGANLVLIGDFLWRSFICWDKYKMIVDQMKQEINFHINIKRDNEIIKRLYDISRDKLLFAIPPDVNTIAIS